MNEVRSRRSDEALSTAIREATRGQLARGGYGSVTYEGIARDVHTSKPVLYRRYPTRAHIILDAISSSAAEQLDPPHTGSLRGDLVGVLDRMAQQFARFPADVYRGLIGESGSDLLDDAIRTLGEVSDRSLSSILEAARARGELGTEAVPARVISLPVALLRHELLFGHPFDPASVDDIVDQIYLPLLEAVTFSRGGRRGH